MLTAEGLIVIEVNGRMGGAVYELMGLSSDTTGLTPATYSSRSAPVLYAQGYESWAE